MHTSEVAPIGVRLQIEPIAAARGMERAPLQVGLLSVGYWVMQMLERFLLGGLIVSVFAIIGDVLRPRGFAGLFGAAPSVALATLTLTLLSEGKAYAALEARSMIAGAIAFFFYALSCVYLMARKHRRAAPTALTMLFVWGICAFGFWSLILT